jgi:PAS domain S-box-containing protein
VRVKQKLKIYIVVAILTAILIFLILSLGLHEIRRAVRASVLSEELMTGAFERSTLRSDYVRSGSERAKKQWFAKHEQIGRNLKSASKIFLEPEDIKTIHDLIKDQETTGMLFSEIVATQESPKPDPSSAALAQKKEDRLVAQLEMRLYKKILLVHALRDSAGTRLSSALKRAGLGIIVGLIILISAAVLNSWAMGRVILDRIQRLREGISVIGAGNLDYVIDVRGNDEFTELSNAFNTMSRELRWSYHELGREIDARKQVEKELEHQMEEVRHNAMELDAIFKVLPYFVSVIGNDGSYLRVNPAMLDFFGVDFTTAPREEIAARIKARFPDGQMFTPGNLLSDRALKGETVRDAEYLITDERGNEHVLLGNAVPLKFGGEVHGAVLAHIDITELKQAQEALCKVNDRLEERVHRRTRELQEAVEIIEAEGKRYKELNETLEQRIMERTAELRESNESYRASRVAALNLMEDAMAARKHAEEVSEELRKEIAARLQAEGELRRSEELLRLHAENSPMAIIEWNNDFVITRWAGEAAHIFGWDAAETVGKPLMDMRMIYEEDIPIVEQTMGRLTDGISRKVVASNRNYTKDGRIILCEWYNSVLFDAEGRMLSVMSQVLDVTDRKMAEESLLESERKLRLFIEHAPAAIAMFDRSMKYMAVSRRWLTDYGLGDAGIIGRSHYEIFPEITDRWKKIHQSGMAGESEVCEEDPFPRMDGSIDWVRWEVHPWYGHAGDVGGIIIFTEVITKRKQAEEKLRESEERFRATLDNMMEGCQIIGSDWRYLYLNDSADVHNKRPKEELLGNIYMDMWPGVEGTEVFRVLKHCLEERVSHHMENEFVFPDGTRGWFDLSIQPVPEGIFILSIDITERKQMEAALQESLDRLHLAHKAAHSGTWEWDVMTNENTWSDEVWDLYGIAPQSVKPSYEAWRQAIHPDSLINAEQVMQKAVQEGEELNVEFRVGDIDGTKRWLMSRAQPVRDDHGQVARYIGVVMDITERKKMEAEVFNALAELERSNKELEQFAYVASHDLQEPLRMVSSFTQLLARRYGDKLEQDARDYIDFAVKGSNRMQRMIQDLLNYSRVVTRGRMPEPTDMGKVLDETLVNLSLAISDSGASVTHDDLPVVVADHSQLVQVMQNLIGNAIKFRRDDPVRIHVSAARTGDEWVFAVKDNGMGIETQYFERIFLLFERLHAGEKYRGTGIGLALCKRIIERLGGRIWVDSEPGKGTTFYFTLRGEER